MDVVRQALNESKLNYLGFSYGTIIGSTYAELFPENVGRMVLDGVADHSVSDIASITTQSITLELTLNKFFEWCDTTSDCVLQGKDSGAIFDSVIATADVTPIPAPLYDGTDLARNDTNAEEILIRVKSLLTFEVEWPLLALAIAQSAQGNSSLFAMPIVNEPTSVFFSALSIGTLDYIQTSNTWEAFAQKELLVSTFAPHSRGIAITWALLARAIGWPVASTNPPRPFAASILDAPPILLVNSLYDPATSLEWANSVRTQIPKSALIIRNGGGHMSYPILGETANAIDGFLVDGSLPTDGSRYDS